MDEMPTILTVELEDGPYTVKLIHEGGQPGPGFDDEDRLLEIGGMLYAKSREHEVLFSDYTRGDPKAFFILFADPRSVWYGIWKDDSPWPIGSFYMTDVLLGYDADAHFTLWDSRLRGREPLALAVLDLVFQRYKLERLTSEFPKSQGALAAFLKGVGFEKEGVRRHAILRNGEWKDAVRMGILKEDLSRLLKEAENGRVD